MTGDDFEAFGLSLIRAVARGIDAVSPGFGARLRAQHAAEHGVCRDCARPLGGPSPSRICTECHAARVLAGLGGNGGGDA